MSLDPFIKSMLDQSPPQAPADSVPVESLREMVRQYARMTPPLDVPLSTIEDRTIPADGHDMAVRIYTPLGAGPHPVVVYFHGGGFVMGDLDTQDMICRALCSTASVVVVSVDYRLAPEHKFPAALDDASAAVQWAYANAGRLNADPERLAVAGDSAGATLSASVSLRLRDAGASPIKAQMLFYGSMEYNPPGSSASMIEFEHGPIVSARDVTFFWAQYLPSLDFVDPLSQPSKASSHAGLPPAFLASAECDPLRDAGESYAKKLGAAGVPAQYRCYEGMPHGFLSWMGVLEQARQAIRDASAWLNDQWAGGAA